MRTYLTVASLLDGFAAQEVPSKDVNIPDQDWLNCVKPENIISGTAMTDFASLKVEFKCDSTPRNLSRIWSWSALLVPPIVMLSR